MSDDISAFPHNQVDYYEGRELKHTFSGMSLRDYFAAKSLEGLIAASPENMDEKWRESTARDCFAMADAMLRARAA